MKVHAWDAKNYKAKDSRSWHTSTSSFLWLSLLQQNPQNGANVSPTPRKKHRQKSFWPTIVKHNTIFLSKLTNIYLRLPSA